MTLYRIGNYINEKVYVGQTTRTLSERWKQHLRDSVKLDYPLYRAMRKYGVENFYIEEISTHSDLEELNKAEIETISNLQSNNEEFGYNVLSGGKNYKMPQSIKDKISKANKGKKYKQHISNEEKSKIARENGMKHGYNEKWAIANGSLSFRVYKAICVQFRTRIQPSIYVKGEYMGEWLTSSQCAKDLKIKSNHIRSCLVNKRIQTNGFIFERIKGE